MSKYCVLKITPSTISFILADETSSMIWTTMKKEHFFVDYLMVGKSVENNEIYLELNTGMLANSISSCKTSAKFVKIKLTNKQQPCLSFEIELPSIVGDSRMCVHDVPISIISQKHWKVYEAPKIPKYDVCIVFVSFIAKQKFFFYIFEF